MIKDLSSNSVFLLPIEYDKKKVEIVDTLREDLELVKSKNENVPSVYDTIFQPSTDYGKELLSRWGKFYTTNKKFLRESKDIYSKLKPEIKNEHINVFDKSYDVFKNDTGFLRKYQYLDWKRFEFLNENQMFLQGLSLYNLSSPFFSLVIPLVSLIIPFFMIKIMNKNVTFDAYKVVLIQQLRNNSIFKVFTNFSGVSGQQKFYLGAMALVYITNIYQNILACIRFYSNFSIIHDFFNSATSYFSYVRDEMNRFLECSKNLTTYSLFNKKLDLYKTTVESYLGRIRKLQPFRITDIFKIGKKMKLFHEFRYNTEFINTCDYCQGFIGYLDNVTGLQHHLKNKSMKYGKVGKSTQLTNLFHPALLKKSPIKNSVKLDKNFIISGPNASGKTTLLKSILINVILTQQIYCGFYDKCQIKLVDHFHCYLNIPDTNARDSLFQAEARRCKEILDVIHEGPSKNHLCIFDELYSGTNPFEAVGSAYSYLTYLSENPNVNFMLTTHFLKLCDLVKENEQIINKKMKASVENEDVKYDYIIEDGISNVKSGFQVLKNLNYPDSILEKVFSFN